jgi:hypothetical protein
MDQRDDSGEDLACHHLAVPEFGFSYKVDSEGWADFEVRAGKRAMRVAASSFSDVPQDVLDAVLALQLGAAVSWVSWFTEGVSEGIGEFAALEFRRVGPAVGVRLLDAGSPEVYEASALRCWSPWSSCVSWARRW